MTRLALVLAAVALLALPAVADAKELASATACGASGCRDVDHPSEALTSGGDGISDPIPAVGGFYTVTFRIDEEGVDAGSWSLFWIPSDDTVAFRDEYGNTTFERVSGETLAAFRDLTKGLAPYPAPKVIGAKVDGKPVDDPASYVGLFGRGHDSSIFPDASDWRPVELTATAPSPWTDTILLTVSTEKGILEAGGTSVARLDAGEAQAIAAGAPLPDVDSGRGWLLPALAVGAAAVLAVVLVLLMRRVHRRPGADPALSG